MCPLPGRTPAGNFYPISIEAVADPFPPPISAEELAADLREQIEQLLARMQGLSEPQALGQANRGPLFYLCVPCYRPWIENPTNDDQTPLLSLDQPSNHLAVITWFEWGQAPCFPGHTQGKRVLVVQTVPASHPANRRRTKRKLRCGVWNWAGKVCTIICKNPPSAWPIKAVREGAQQ